MVDPSCPRPERLFWMVCLLYPEKAMIVPPNNQQRLRHVENKQTHIQHNNMSN
jgi:hypothetical protein